MPAVPISPVILALALAHPAEPRPPMQPAASGQIRDAAPSQLAGRAMSALNVTSLGAPSLCLVFTYDANGNRTSQQAQATPTTPAKWGENIYPCFSWSGN